VDHFFVSYAFVCKIQSCKRLTTSLAV
jgi:hypothetical protein